MDAQPAILGYVVELRYTLTSVCRMAAMEHEMIRLARQTIRQCIRALPPNVMSSAYNVLIRRFVDREILGRAQNLGRIEYARRSEVWSHVYNYYIGSPDAKIAYFEFGVFEGESIKWWLTKNTNTASVFVGFDSFEGLPEDWFSGDKKTGHFTTGGTLPDTYDTRVGFVKGWFNSTLSPFFSNNEPDPDAILIFHFDADLFTSTLFAGFIVLNKFKDRRMLWIFDEFVPDEARAFEILSSTFGVRYKPICCDSSATFVVIAMDPT
jgi:O-methyltransferase